MFVPSPALLTEWHIKKGTVRERTWARVNGDSAGLRKSVVSSYLEQKQKRERATRTHYSPPSNLDLNSRFPSSWGPPPTAQTRDLRPLPGGYGQGSSTLARWIEEKMAQDTKRGVNSGKNGDSFGVKVTLDNTNNGETGRGDPNAEYNPQAVLNWVGLSDFYTWPHIHTFDSFTHLFALLESGKGRGKGKKGWCEFGETAGA